MIVLFLYSLSFYLILRRQSYGSEKVNQMFDFWKKMFKCKILIFELVPVLSWAYFKMLFKKVRESILITEAKDR